MSKAQMKISQYAFVFISLFSRLTLAESPHTSLDDEISSPSEVNKLNLFCEGKTKAALCEDLSFSNLKLQASQNILDLIDASPRGSSTLPQNTIATLAKIENSLPQVDFKKISQSLRAAIRSSALAPRTKTLLDGKLSKVSLLNLAEIADGHEEELNSFYDNHFQRTCANEGQAVSAFTVFKKSGPSIYLCPALRAYAQKLRTKVSPQAADSFLASVVWHEMGHAIDSIRAPQVYGPYKACLQRKSAANAKEPLFREVTADYWAANSLAESLKKNTHPQKRWNELLGALIFYCPEKPTPKSPEPVLVSEINKLLAQAFPQPKEPPSTHPSEHFRLTENFGNSFALHRSLKCPTPPNKKNNAARSYACTLHGQLAN